MAQAVCGLLVAAASGYAVPPLPPDKRVEATIVRTLTAPAGQPMHMPTDVAVDHAGRVFVADGANNRVLRFTGNGRLDLAMTAPGGHDLSRPIGLTVDSADRLWIADSGHHRIVVIGADGDVAETIDVPPPEGGRVSNPTDVSVTADGGRTYIADSNNHRILIRDNRTRQLTSLGRFGRSLGQFEWPFMVCIAPNGYIYISEAIGARAQRLSPSDRWAGEIPPGAAWGVELGQVFRPKGVAADADNRVYVGDSTLGVVQVFGDRGDVLGALTGAGGDPLRFKHPMGLCFDSAGLLYVVELAADRVTVVSLRGGSTMPTTAPAEHAAGGGR